MPNWFVLVAGFLYLGASVSYARNDEWKMCGVFIAYSVANIVLSFVHED